MKQRPNKVLSIVGKSPGFDGCYGVVGDVWCVSTVFKQLKPDVVDYIFQMHKPDIWEDWLYTEMERVVVAFPGIYEIYPVKEILNKYGPVFGSSISWMLALAIEQGYKEINIFGCDMASQVEYIDQRDTFFYMCGRAEALGIKIIIPESSRVYFKDRIYGVI